MELQLFKFHSAEIFFSKSKINYFYGGFGVREILLLLINLLINFAEVVFIIIMIAMHKKRTVDE